RTPKKVAVTDNRSSIAYQDLVRRTENLAASLLDLGLAAGEVVAVQAPNWSELLIAHLALDRIGGIFLPVHDGFRATEMRHLLQTAGAVALIHPAAFHGFEHRALAEALAPELPALRHRIVLRAAPQGSELSFDTLCENDGWREAQGQEWLRGHRPSAQEPLQIMVSSGTTSMPKCSIFSDNNMVFKLVSQYGRYATQMTDRDIGASIAPAGTGATGYNYPIIAPLLHGGSSVLLERWDGNRPGQALELIARHRCTFAVMIPTQLVKLLRSPHARDYDLSSLRFISNAGAKLADSDAEEAERIFGCPVQTVYGATDAGVPTMTRIADPAPRRRTAGHVLPGEEVRIIRDDGTEAAPGEPGEVTWRGANSSYGYLAAVDHGGVWDEDGWYHSGDLGTVDEEGYLVIVGRKKDMIIRGGHNINPHKIEEILIRHPAVVDAAVVPVRNAVLGEQIGAAIVLAHGQLEPSLAELARFVLDADVPKWYQPEYLKIFQDFPRNAGGKVDKRQISLLFEQDSQDSAAQPATPA
ncbi:class I adenylate-forming enzyme family protein, partial [Hoeflea sp.]|uniref:class I adenylate-forming enzyme family protein n=1 Tax=Hoeflea sp. TaxID=1940281 RepID=UPI0019A38ABB